MTGHVRQVSADSRAGGDRFSAVVARTSTTHMPVGLRVYDCVEVALVRSGSATLFGELEPDPLSRTVSLSRVKILGRAVESVLKENQIYGKTPFDSGREEDSDRVERACW